MKKEVGIVREIDRNGRLVIPMELRRLYNLVDEVEIIACEEGVLVRNPRYEVVEKKKEED